MRRWRRASTDEEIEGVRAWATQSHTDETLARLRADKLLFVRLKSGVEVDRGRGDSEIQEGLWGQLI